MTNGDSQNRFETPPEAARLQQRALVVGVIGAVACIAGSVLSPQQFFRSYLIGYLFWTGITLGCLAIVMLQHLSGGGWGLVIRRLLESGTRTLPLIAILFVPLVFGLGQLYTWVHGPDAIADEALKHAIEHKRPYLNLTFFLIRAGFYFAIWAGLAYLVNRWSSEQDHTDDPRPRRRLEAISGPGLILFGLTVTFASIDWVMSLDPEWFSTIFGILFMGGQALSAMAFVIAVIVVLGMREPMSRIVSARHLHDLGKLLLAFVMLWAYFSFSQFLIIWSGNLAEEVPWYQHRLHGGWQYLGLGLILFHFAFPFLMLLSSDLKRSGKLLATVAVVVIIMRFVDLLWLVAPEFSKDRLSLHWLDIAAPVAVGGLWLWLFVHQLRKRPLIPIYDPGVEGLLEREH